MTKNGGYGIYGNALVDERQQNVNTNVDLVQIGGDHYKSLTVQPWEVMQDILKRVTITPFQAYLWGNIIKYAMRCWFKGQCKQDLEKLVHYANKLISLL